MSRLDTVSIASEFIGSALPIHPKHSEGVRAVVGSKWSYSAGAFNLSPQKRIVRKLELNDHRQRSRFDDLFVSNGGTPEFRAIFVDPEMQTSFWGDLNHDGELHITQTPIEASIDFPRITTADVGRMMLANDILYEQGVADFRPPKLHIASALLNLCAAN